MANIAKEIKYISQRITLLTSAQANRTVTKAKLNSLKKMIMETLVTSASPCPAQTTHSALVPFSFLIFSPEVIQYNI